MLCNCLSSSFLHHFSRITGKSNDELGAKKYFTDHWTGITIQLFVAIKGNFFWSILFLNKSEQRGIPQILLDKFTNLFICTSLKQTLSNGQKPVSTVKIVISKRITLTANCLLQTSFCILKVDQQKRVEMVSTNNM